MAVIDGRRLAWNVVAGSTRRVWRNSSSQCWRGFVRASRARVPHESGQSTPAETPVSGRGIRPSAPAKTKPVSRALKATTPTPKRQGRPRRGYSRECRKETDMPNEGCAEDLPAVPHAVAHASIDHRRIMVLTTQTARNAAIRHGERVVKIATSATRNLAAWIVREVQSRRLGEHSERPSSIPISEATLLNVATAPHGVGVRLTPEQTVRMRQIDEQALPRHLTNAP
jgi:hypothetical protein